MSAQAGLEAYLEVEEKESQSLDRGTVRRVLREILAQPGLLAAGLVTLLVTTLAALAEPWLFGVAIDRAISPPGGGQGDAALLRLLTVLFFGVVLLRVVSVIGNAYLFEKLGQRVMQKIRVRLFSHLQVLPVSIYDKTPAGKLVTRVTNDVGSMSEMFSAGFVTMIGNVLMVVGIITGMLLLDVKLGLMGAATLPVLAAVSVHFSRKLHTAYRNARSKLSALNAFLAENILGMRVVHLFNRQGLHLSRFTAINQWYNDAQMGTVRIFAVFQPAITLCQGFAMAAVLGYGGWRLSEGSIPLGTLVAVFSYVLALFQPLREIADKWNVFLSGMASAERIFSVMDWKPELDAQAMAGLDTDVKAFPDLKGEIVFENVWFAYDGAPGSEHWVLRDFSLRIPAGSSLGVVGHTGAGKTTLISLLMRFYEPQRGRILLDGKDLREFPKRQLRASIGIVQQDVFLFSGSVADNVSLGREGGEAVPVERWLQDLQRPDLAIRARETQLDERGSNLSVGERQMLAFLRARASHPRLWILDEATANIDSSTEERIEQELKAASSGRTLIRIAHRLATVRTCDQILVLHKGVAVERGTHEELLRARGAYSRLYQYQRALEESAPPAAH